MDFVPCFAGTQNPTLPASQNGDLSEHQLALRTVCLGNTAKDEFHIVEIVLQAVEGSDAKPVPIATLKPSILPMATMVGIELTPPVTFKLKSGSGTIFISGQRVALEEDHSWAEEEVEEEVEEEEDPESPPKPVKRPAASKKAGQAKKKKMEKDGEESSEEEDSPAKKGRGRGRKSSKK
ncbi:nucleoplasmin-like [Aquarana catesbeiana]|uniref:nucleoplasmin-like n=1 Tax=Aquarana catesbeiana TaxID=8400 RepID=UPI003CC95446